MEALFYTYRKLKVFNEISTNRNEPKAHFCIYSEL